LLNSSAKTWLNNPDRMTLLVATASLDQIDPAEFDAIYFTGGDTVMFDYSDSEGLQAITRTIWERGGVVSAVCHGYCDLLNTKLFDGKLLVAGRWSTGCATIHSSSVHRVTGITRASSHS
jgi:putative intracellular protease/amidase